MPDRFSTEKRHEIMSAIKGKDTKIEVMVRLWLYHHGIRYRKNLKVLHGTPDIILTRYKVAIFVNGCFWHSHEGCKYASHPKSRVEYWEPKLAKNVERDMRHQVELTDAGWHVFVVWECEIATDFEGTMEKLLSRIEAVKTEDFSH